MKISRLIKGIFKGSTNPLFAKKGYETDFVKRQKELSSRIISKTLWLSREHPKKKGITYVRKLHGELGC